MIADTARLFGAIFEFLIKVLWYSGAAIVAVVRKRRTRRKAVPWPWPPPVL